MLKFVPGLLGVSALAISLGAAQYAVGHDLSGTRVAIAAASQTDHVNRAVKGDRPATVAAVSASTIVTQLNAFNDTSIVIRVAQPQRGMLINGRLSRRPVACEAPASVLTETAKLMESGRCIT